MNALNLYNREMLILSLCSQMQTRGLYLMMRDSPIFIADGHPLEI